MADYPLQLWGAGSPHEPERTGEYTDLISREAVDKRAVDTPIGGFRWLLCDFSEESKKK